ncbi:hypothetical protein V6N13_111375 [Hibiscus sabdariffa]
MLGYTCQEFNCLYCVALTSDGQYEHLKIYVLLSFRFLEADPKLSFEPLVSDFRLKNRGFRQFSIRLKVSSIFF